MSNLLRLVGIARKAGKLELGEEPVGASARSKKARLILLAVDMAENSHRRAMNFAEAAKVPIMDVAFTKAELGHVVGRASCGMIAVIDMGFAAAMAKMLSEENPERYGEWSKDLDKKAERVQLRQKEKRAHEKKTQSGGNHPWSGPGATPSTGSRKSADGKTTSGSYKSADGSKPASTYKPAGSYKSADGSKPAGSYKSADGSKPASTYKPAGSYKSADGSKPASTYKPAGTYKSADGSKPASTYKPAGTYKSADGRKPANTYKPAGASKPTGSYKSAGTYKPAGAYKSTVAKQTTDKMS